LRGKLTQLLGAADKLKKKGGNEANTKVLLIEPLLAELGWDVTDLDQVEREYRVFDGTSLDYALKIDGMPALFVEAKAIGKNLDDKQFISQTVNYANNEGVVWCVLTGGLAYRVYRTNEPVGMDEKLLFEVDVGEAADSPGEVADALRRISRDSLESGDLDRWGEQVFVDKRVRDVLAAFAKQPPPELIDAVQEQLGKPAVTPEGLRESLGRILDVGQAAPPLPAKKTAAAAKPSGGKKGKPKEYALDFHLSSKPASIVDLFEQVDEFGRSLGPDVTRRVRKFYVGYFAGERSFLTVEVQRKKLLVYLNLDPTATSPWNEKWMRDVREIGHFGMGDTEYLLRGPDQLDGLKELTKQAYANAK
jgi:predicted transport protein